MNLWLLDRSATCRRWPWAAGGMLLAVAALAGCSSDSKSGQAQAARTPVVQVTASAAVQKAVPVQLQANGNAQAYSTVSIMSQVDGQIAQVHFTEGQDVKKGDLLFTLDRGPFEAALRQSEGILARDRAQQLQAQAALAQTRAAEKQAVANLARDQAQLENANVEVRRYKELIDEGAISKEQFDSVRTTANAMEATVQ
ncbi:MAG TPA: biotin/lipoyl-binding protein, partial [bacterium]|nr:biotin/lipoyl-binding protein [bacterium]